MDPRVKPEDDGGEAWVSGRCSGAASGCVALNSAFSFAVEGRRRFPARATVRQTVRCFSLNFSSGVILGLDPRTHSRMRRRPRRPSSGDVNASHPLIFQQNPLPISPPSPTVPTMPLIPPSDTPQGVAARRGRRGAWGDDAKPHAPGLRKMVSLRRHGGNGGMSDRSCRFMPRTARRACLCGTQGDGDWRMRRHRPPAWRKAGRWRHLPRSAKACAPDVKRHCPFRKPAKDTAFSILAERPESRAKTAERGAGRCHLNIFQSRQLPAPRPTSFDTRCARTRVRHRMP
jgi:hypothetical protein